MAAAPRREPRPEPGIDLGPLKRSRGGGILEDELPLSFGHVSFLKVQKEFWTGTFIDSKMHEKAARQHRSDARSDPDVEGSVPTGWS